MSKVLEGCEKITINSNALFTKELLLLLSSLLLLLSLSKPECNTVMLKGSNQIVIVTGNLAFSLLSSLLYNDTRNIEGSSGRAEELLKKTKETRKGAEQSVQ